MFKHVAGNSEVKSTERKCLAISNDVGRDDAGVNLGVVFRQGGRGFLSGRKTRRAPFRPADVHDTPKTSPERLDGDVSSQCRGCAASWNFSAVKWTQTAAANRRRTYRRPGSGNRVTGGHSVTGLRREVTMLCSRIR